MEEVGKGTVVSNKHNNFNPGGDCCSCAVWRPKPVVSYFGYVGNLSYILRLCAQRRYVHNLKRYSGVNLIHVLTDPGTEYDPPPRG